MYDDVKHIRKAAVGRLASNIKRAMRKAYGITLDGSTPSVSRNSSKKSVQYRLENIAGYSKESNTWNQKSSSQQRNISPDPNIVLMQLAQLLRLTAPS